MIEEALVRRASDPGSLIALSILLAAAMDGRDQRVKARRLLTLRTWEMALFNQGEQICQRLTLTSFDGPARFRGTVGGCHYELPLDVAEGRSGTVRAVWGPVSPDAARVVVEGRMGEQWGAQTYPASGWARSTWVVFVPMAADLEHVRAYGARGEILAERRPPEGS